MAKIHNVSHVTYLAWDADKSFDFLVNALGCYPQRRGNTLYVGIGDTLIELIRVEPSAELAPQDPNRYVFGVAVESLEESISQLEAAGASVVKPIWISGSFWGRQVVIAPPGGPQIALREWEAPDGPHFTDWAPR